MSLHEDFKYLFCFLLKKNIFYLYLFKNTSQNTTKRLKLITILKSEHIKIQNKIREIHKKVNKTNTFKLGC